MKSCSGHQHFAGTIMRSFSWFGQQILTKRWYPLNQTAILTLCSYINFHPVTFKFTVSDWCQNDWFTQRLRYCNLMNHNCTVCSEWLQVEARARRSYELAQTFTKKCRMFIMRLTLSVIQTFWKILFFIPTCYFGLLYLCWVLEINYHSKCSQKG
jgi:hypothetical protein